MSKKKKWMTAAEFMAELEKDPEYQERKRAREEKRRQCIATRDERNCGILIRLAEMGYPIESLDQIAKKYAPLPRELVSVLREFLDASEHDRQREWLVRSLGAAKEPFDGVALRRCYERTSDETVRWAIANTISLAHPHSIDDWIKSFPYDSPLKQTLMRLGYFS